MIVPRFWAEARLQQRQRGRQLTVRRFGWSDDSQAAAEQHARDRAAAALQRLLAGEPLHRRDLKRSYNGAQGMPIREEIVERHGATIITRNSYGARCLNSPDVLFVDVDFDDTVPLGLSFMLTALLFGSGTSLAWSQASFALGGLAAVLALLSGPPLAGPLHRGWRRWRGKTSENDARKRIEDFVTSHPDWNLRIYRTPAGLRLLATHRPFQPHEATVGESLERLGADRLYALMCRNQNCFRARVSGKPWRMGISTRMRPRKAVWPLPPEKLELRRGWVQQYELVACSFAACEWVESLGSGVVHPAVQPVVELHDRLCQAHSKLPLA